MDIQDLNDTLNFLHRLQTVPKETTGKDAMVMASNVYILTNESNG